MNPNDSSRHRKDPPQLSSPHSHSTFPTTSSLVPESDGRDDPAVQGSAEIAPSRPSSTDASLPSYQSLPSPHMADSSSNGPDRHSTGLSTPHIPSYTLSRVSSNAFSAPDMSPDFDSDTFNSLSRNVHLESSSLPRPVSPFRAPRPPLYQRSSRTLLSRPTAMQGYMMPSDDATSYPSPDPPVILPPENSIITSQSSFLSQAPYFPFLSHAPPPENSWIEVETLQHEYKLHVRLPGFTGEGITLATKKRRILHVVANKWENGGGK